jgi:hypothetical protein
MSSPPQVGDLLARWNELRERGEAVSAEQLCADHPELLAELRQRIQTLDGLAPRVTSSVQAPTARTATLPPRAEAGGTGLDFLGPPQEPDEIGRLGRYRVLRTLGVGGMGMVFEAEDPRLGRRIALKVMRPERAEGPVARQRFLREARALAAVTHDHIVPVYEADEAGGVLYLAMPLLPGESLDARLRRDGPLPVAEVLRLGREAAEGLAAAHARGLVHRDVKPSNLWLEALPEAAGADGSRSRAKLLDFGLARPTGGEPGVTEPGMVVGTPAYMAPEQAAGHSVDGRADLFSLGCVLYQACTGRPPFQGGDTIATLMAVATEQPPAPLAVNPAVPLALSELILRLLAKAPAERPANAREVSAALQDLEHDRSPANASTGAETVAYRTPRTARRGWRRAAVAVALFTVLAAGVVALVSRWSRPDGDQGSAPPVPGAPAGVAAGPQAPLVVRSLRIQRTIVEGEQRQRLDLGVDAFFARFGDQVRLTAELSEPAYSFLLAFNPDGKEQLCLPTDPQRAPERLAQLTFPPETGYVFNLDDGTGLQAFVLVAARQPLPAYEEWKKARPALAWRKVPVNVHGVWRGDGRQGLAWQLAAGPDVRGKVSQEVDLAPLEQVCRQLRAAPGIEALSVVAFPVLK